MKWEDNKSINCSSVSASCKASTFFNEKFLLRESCILMLLSVSPFSFFFGLPSMHIVCTIDRLYLPLAMPKGPDKKVRDKRRILRRKIYFQLLKL